MSNVDVPRRDAERPESPSQDEYAELEDRIRLLEAGVDRLTLASGRPDLLDQLIDEIETRALMDAWHALHRPAPERCPMLYPGADAFVGVRCSLPLGHDAPHGYDAGLVGPVWSD